MKLVSLALTLTLAVTCQAQALTPGVGPAVAPSTLPVDGTVRADAASLELARTLVDTLHADAFEPDAYMRAMREATYKSADLDGMTNAGMQSGLRAELERTLALVEPIVRQHLPALLDGYARAYAREFSASEMQQLIAFAATPAGARLLSKMYDIPSDPLVEAANEQMLLEMAPAIEAMQTAMCQRATATRIAAGETNAKCSRA